MLLPLPNSTRTGTRSQSWVGCEFEDRIRGELEAKRAVLLGDVSALEDEALKSNEDDVSVDHMADHGSDSFEQDQAIGLLERESKALRTIQKALLKLKDGNYGICEECEEKITPKRLEARPETTMCIKCKEAQERREKALADN